MFAKNIGTGCSFLWNFSLRHAWVLHQHMDAVRVAS